MHIAFLGGLLLLVQVCQGAWMSFPGFFTPFDDAILRQYKPCYGCSGFSCRLQQNDLSTVASTRYINGAKCYTEFGIGSNVKSIKIGLELKTADSEDAAFIYQCPDGTGGCNMLYYLKGDQKNAYTLDVPSNVHLYQVFFFADYIYDTSCYDESSCAFYGRCMTIQNWDNIQGDNPGVSITFELDSCQSGYGSDGSVNCVACPAGKFSYKARCFECSSGTYQPAAMATTCLVCGAGTYTPFQAAGFTSCLTCQPGTYSDDKKARCENCNAGTYNPSYGGAYYASCLPCSAGNYSLDQATACIQCQAGKYQEFSRQSSCLTCPVGKASANVSATSLQACIKCSSGYFSSVDGAECVGCQVGKYLATAATACIECGPGKYAPEKQLSSCLWCDKGTWNNVSGATGCQECAAGTYAESLGSINCTTCPAGFFSFAKSSTCYTCLAGTFSNRTGATSFLDCLSCPAGKFSDRDGASACTQCNPGTVAPSPGSSSCSVCGKGMYASASGTQCIQCQAGAYQDSLAVAKTACTLCIAGKMSAAVGATSEASCVLCNQGNQYSNQSGSTMCYQCPVDYAVASPDYKGCSGQPCDPGWVPNYMFASAVISYGCDRCMAGKIESTNGTCTDCPSGTYQDMSGRTSCVDCPFKGQISVLPRSSSSNCICPSGQFQNTADNACRDCFNCNSRQLSTYFTRKCDTQWDRAAGAGCTLDCGANKYIAVACSCEDDAKCAACTSCPAGKYVSAPCNGVANNDCASCAPGFFSSLEQQSSCAACPAGRYASSGGSSQCASCPAGKTSSAGSSVCTLCPAGTFSSADASAQCTACPAGKFSSAAGSTTCSSCSSGYNQSLAGSTSCQPCPPGTSAPLPETQWCDPCLPGMYASSNGSSYCTACPAGKRSSVPGTVQCTNCSAGSFASGSGLAAASCPLCSPGFFAMEPGSAACLPCPLGSFSAANGTVSCTLCSAGYAADQLGSTQCKICGAGTFSTYGDTALCKPCPVGTFSAKQGSANCTACRDDVSFANVSGSVACTACSPLCTNGTEEQARPCNATWDRKCVPCTTKKCTTVARQFRTSGTVTYAESILADILLVGGGAGGSPAGGGDPGVLILQLNYTLLAGTYLVSVGSGGGDTSFGDLFVARGGNSLRSQLSSDNKVNGIGGIGPTLSSSYVVVDNAGETGITQISVPGRDLPLFLCADMGVACSPGTELAAPGKSWGDAYALDNTGSGGDGGFYGGAGGSGIVVVRIVGTISGASNVSAASCTSKCAAVSVNAALASTVSIPFSADTLVDLLLVGGGAGGTAAGGGSAGNVVFYKNFLLPAGTYLFTVGAGGAANSNGGDTSIGSLFVARGGGAAAQANVVAGAAAPVLPGAQMQYSYATYANGAGAAGLNNVSLLAGENFVLCSHFSNMGATCTVAEGGRNLASVNAIPGSGGWMTSVPGSNGLIAIRNSVGAQERAGLCQSMCVERELRGGTICMPGSFLNGSSCAKCPRNTYRDMSVQDGRQCMQCMDGFVSSTVGGAASALACKNWCIAARKERGLVTVDTFPKIVVGSGAGNLAKI